EKLPHTYDEANATVVPSPCTAAGSRSYACTICGETVRETLPLAEHKIGAGGKCTVCGKQIESVSKSIDLSLTCEANKETTVGASLRSSLYGAFRDAFSATFSSVSFGTPEGTNFGTLYADADRTALGTRSYTYSTAGSYPLSALCFVATAKLGNYLIPFTATDDTHILTGTLKIVVSNTGASTGVELLYTVQPGGAVAFDREDFFGVLSNINRVVFTADSSLASAGRLYARHGRSDEQEFTAATLKEEVFYYSAASASRLLITDLTFVAAEDFTGELRLPFTIYSSGSKTASGTLTIASEEPAQPDITRAVAPNGTYRLEPKDFNDFLHDRLGASYDLDYVIFTASGAMSEETCLAYLNYGSYEQELFAPNTDGVIRFYYSPAANAFGLDDITFVTGSAFSVPLKLEFTAYHSSTRKTSGTLCIEPDESSAATRGDILCLGTAGNAIQLNANEFDRFFRKVYPNATLSHVKLGNAPATGSLYYNYYNNSAYNTQKTLLEKANCATTSFYFNPSASQYALTALTYIPDGSNYCVSIPFTAYGGERSVGGTVLISITKSAVSEVYGAVPVDTPVPLPASAIVSTVSAATGITPAGIRFLSLPAAEKGVLYADNGGVSATTKDIYAYSSFAGSTYRMSTLRFVPAAKFTGSVELPYAAYDAKGNAVGVGRFCLGVMETQKKFSDISSTTWCYKYVTELASSGVIDGYADGTYKQQNTITYGAALKLILLAAGYGEQKPVENGGTFSGYLALAKEKGFVNGTPDLAGTITRGQVAQIAARAMGLSVNNLPAQKPFTDTADVYIQALNAAGIVEGYFENGTSTFKPGNTLTRGHVSAIVWRMYNYEK
ncbi:MAG: S-layer homology domain-containing protein, partial [Oscillibacter sp.]|nr:S-layer homology domain-containing protein [Oscillibacter sp.]